MKAKDMFEQLGYEKFEYSKGIRYTNEQTEQNIEFEDCGFINIYNTCYNKPDDIEVLIVEEIQAINKQIEELGWDDVKECENQINLLKQEKQQLKEELKYTVPIVEHNKIVSEKNKENQQLKEVIEEVREYIEKHHSGNLKITFGGKLLQILDKVGDIDV